MGTRGFSAFLFFWIFLDFFWIFFLDFYKWGPVLQLRTATPLSCWQFAELLFFSLHCRLVVLDSPSSYKQVKALALLWSGHNILCYFRKTTVLSCCGIILRKLQAYDTMIPNSCLEHNILSFLFRAFSQPGRSLLAKTGAFGG